jgi:transposase
VAGKWRRKSTETRAEAVRQVRSGKNRAAVAARFRVTIRTVDRWRLAADDPRPTVRLGRPPKLTANQIKALERLVEKRPQISRDELRKHAKEHFRCAFHPKYFARVLRRHGLATRRS